jgi:cytoplasmic iron level regulating protein YaaA (DUF328/UPF0246 family)
VKIVVNVASAEYFKSVNVKKLQEKGVRVVECVFKNKVYVCVCLYIYIYACK